MNSLWYLYESELSADLCVDILSHWNDIKAQQGKVSNRGKLDTSVRSSKINQFPYASKEQKKFSEILEPYITVANKECFGVDLNGFSEFQIAEYTTGDFYDEHIDCNVNDSASMRKISITIQLNNPNEYEGGDFVFGSHITNPNKDTLRKKGTILCFPSFLPHKIEKVTKGKRFALVGWYEGKKWC